MSDSIELKELRDEMLRAFRGWRIPRDVAKEVGQIDEPGADELGLRLVESHWSDIGPEVLRMSSFVIWMSIRQFSYCLPSYLLACLCQNDDEVEWETIFAIVNHIAAPWPNGQRPKFGIDLNLFSEEQLQAVRHVLQFLRGECFDERPRIQRRIDGMIASLVKGP
jgi:hypothetical protein